MENSHLFITAAKERYRFESPKGFLTVEDLFELPLLHKSNCDLESVAQTVSLELETAQQRSFVNVKPNAKATLLQNKLEIVKIVISIKEAEAAHREREREKRAQLQRLHNALERAEDNALASASVDDIKAKIAELQGA